MGGTGFYEWFVKQVSKEKFEKNWDLPEEAIKAVIEAEIPDDDKWPDAD